MLGMNPWGLFSTVSGSCSNCASVTAALRDNCDPFLHDLNCLMFQSLCDNVACQTWPLHFDWVPLPLSQVPSGPRLWFAFDAKGGRNFACKVVWKSVIRTSELERRLGKGQSMQDELDALQANRSLEDSVKKEADDVQTKLYGQCVEKAALKDFCRALRQSSASALAEEVCFGENNLRELFTRCALPLFQDTSTLMDMIAVAAKRLMDALWQ